MLEIAKHLEINRLPGNQKITGKWQGVKEAGRKMLRAPGLIAEL